MRRRVLIAVIGLLLWLGGGMAASAAVRFDYASTGTCASSCENNTNWSHPVTGTDRGLLLFIQAYGGDGCTYYAWYGNTPMTAVAESGFYDGYFKTYAFKMENPSLSATGISVVSNGW